MARDNDDIVAVALLDNNDTRETINGQRGKISFTDNNTVSHRIQDLIPDQDKFYAYTLSTANINDDYPAHTSWNGLLIGNRNRTANEVAAIYASTANGSNPNGVWHCVGAGAITATPEWRRLAYIDEISSGVPAQITMTAYSWS